MTERNRPSEWKVGHVVSDTDGFFHQGMIAGIRSLDSVDGKIPLYDIVYQDDEGFDRRCSVTEARLVANRRGVPVWSDR